MSGQIFYTNCSCAFISGVSEKMHFQKFHIDIICPACFQKISGISNIKYHIFSQNCKKNLKNKENQKDVTPPQRSNIMLNQLNTLNNLPEVSTKEAQSETKASLIYNPVVPPNKITEKLSPKVPSFFQTKSEMNQTAQNLQLKESTEKNVERNDSVQFCSSRIRLIPDKPKTDIVKSKCTENSKIMGKENDLSDIRSSSSHFIEPTPVTPTLSKNSSKEGETLNVSASGEKIQIMDLSNTVSTESIDESKKLKKRKKRQEYSLSETTESQTSENGSETFRKRKKRKRQESTSGDELPELENDSSGSGDGNGIVEQVRKVFECKLCRQLFSHLAQIRHHVKHKHVADPGRAALIIREMSKKIQSQSMGCQTKKEDCDHCAKSARKIDRLEAKIVKYANALKTVIEHG